MTVKNRAMNQDSSNLGLAIAPGGASRGATSHRPVRRSVAAAVVLAMTTAVTAAAMAATAGPASADSSSDARDIGGCWTQVHVHNNNTQGRINVWFGSACKAGSVITPVLYLRENRRTIRQRSLGAKYVHGGDSIFDSLYADNAPGIQCYNGQLLLKYVTPGGTTDHWLKTGCINV